MVDEMECTEATPSLSERVSQALEEVRPALQSDGGDIELVRVAGDGTVYVRMMGACSGCPMSQLTISEGVERRLKSLVPEVRKVLTV